MEHKKGKPGAKPPRAATARRDREPRPRPRTANRDRGPLPGVRPPGDPYLLRSLTVPYAGQVISVERKAMRLPNGYEAVHENIRHPQAVGIIPVLEERPGHPELILVEQFRSSVGGFIHEIPAGTLAKDEDPLDCARRELLEETGYEAARWSHLATLYPMPGLAAERIHYFVAEGLTWRRELELDPGECLQVRRLPLEGLLRSMLHGESVPGVPAIVDGKTFIAVYYLGARRAGRAQGEIS